MEPKFYVGDIVKINNSETWCNGCDGQVISVYLTEKSHPYYAVRLFESPNPYISVTYVMEKHLELIRQKEGFHNG